MKIGKFTGDAVTEVDSGAYRVPVEIWDEEKIRNFLVSQEGYVVLDRYFNTV